MELLTVDIKHAGYSDNTDVIKNVTLSLKPGELLGLIGPNGAGKSTTIKGIMGLLPVMDGKMNFAGARKNFAYIPEQPILYEGFMLGVVVAVKTHSWLGGLVMLPVTVLTSYYIARKISLLRS